MATHVVQTRRLLLRASVLIIALSFLVQTGGMVLRWMEAGYLEVSAAEKAVGKVLTGWSWFVVFTQHPPWSNLYEIMIYMSWGIVMVTLAAELKWQIAWVRQMGIILALMALGMAALTDATIKPLVPALKSWWIMIHVISASIAYASGFIAAFICLFALMKDNQRVKIKQLIGVGLIGLGVLILLGGGGLKLIVEQNYYVKLLAMAGESVVNVLDMSKEKGVSYLVPMPGIGLLLLMAVLCHLLVGTFILVAKEKVNFQRNHALWFTLCFATTCICLAAMIMLDVSLAPMEIASSAAHHLAPIGPWFISFKSHPWSFSLFVLVLIVEILFMIYLWWQSVLLSNLPSITTLESASYRAISLAFFLMTVVLITGALWAHYAWGRYWAWDPKETGALAIWINYAIYLHTRRTAGLSGPLSSVMGLFGLLVIIIGFLGVNLGLFADGLHTYGNS
jgi:ABC-type transport system involved in cytochrome c biogenesis permease subunit